MQTAAQLCLVPATTTQIRWPKLAGLGIDLNLKAALARDPFQHQKDYQGHRQGHREALEQVGVIHYSLLFLGKVLSKVFDLI
jgi:hypothetical protein